MEEKSLFSEFEPISTKKWKQKIQVDLKGADYNEALVWESLEGIKVKPFYHTEDLENAPGFMFKTPASFKIAECINLDETADAKNKTLNAIKKGAESLWFKIENRAIDWKDAFAGIDFNTIPLYFEFTFLDKNTVLGLLDFLDGKPEVYVLLDPIGHLAKSGNWFNQDSNDLEILNEIINQGKSSEQQSFFGIDTTIYQNGGANIVQQLAYGLAHANEYLNHSQDVIANLSGKSFVFKVAIGPNYFFEIAKLRALRLLWETLGKEYGLEGGCHILAVPSERNKTLYDYNVNILRTTTECMSAVLGGADTVCNMAYDALYHEGNAFAERIARNQLLVLKNESYFDGAASATTGTYYIESLTSQLAEKALGLFKQLEDAGGFLSQLKSRTIQKKIAESADKEQQLFDSGKLVLVGTNKYPNVDDKMKSELIKKPFHGARREKTLIEPILPKRLAEKIEQERLAKE
ncbi:methylmalonyl-CoA mutase subunit beta [Allomuricauda sp. SCSIO 65647]|uniref:methylmalonyl-CoA mutase subunit beta n=1 Tax=Allomuricauda sp. SCSIO 65647 TaxID=2908843 RepID=UPI001F48C526|nr:methylmalonyl-CoA mutase subunit beta [Muricauda sp. SCSIO 65647]UJH67883.1 methylmalonyl-CoA mutase subunit beta [Muricauda sp. SCSIO 65647]